MSTARNDIRELLFALLRSALWGAPLPVSRLDGASCAALMEEARRQTVDGLVCGTLIGGGVRLEKYDAIEAYSTLGTIRQQNETVDEVLHALCRLLRDGGVAFTVMKGQTVGAYYPHPHDRVSGDVDFYCPPESVEKAKETVIHTWQAELEESDVEKHVSFMHGGVDFELHTFLNDFCSRDNQCFFDEATMQARTGTVDVAGVQVPVFEPAFNLAFTFVHLYMHLQELGVGLRQFCDVAVLCHTFRGQETGDRSQNTCPRTSHHAPRTSKDGPLESSTLSEELENILRRLGYLRAFKAVGAILVDSLGLPEEEFPFRITRKDRKYAGYILDIVFKRGNFGKYGRQNEVRSGLLYYLEATWVKLSHYIRLYPLSPKENRAMLTAELPRRIIHTICKKND